MQVRFSYNPQDVTVRPVATATLAGVRAAEGSVETDTVKLRGALEPKDGEYVYPESNARRFTPACAFASVVKTADLFKSYLKKPVKWAFDAPQLGVVGNAGAALNAFYSRQDGSVLFFTGHDNVTGESVASGESGELTAHETGHALLDALRPGYMQSWSPVPGAFHESFGDITALLSTLRDDAVVAQVVEQTGGDLSKPNVAANFGEQLGIAINHGQGHDVTGGDFARTALNSFTWKDPATLPDQAGPEALSREPHSLSRLWTGATYDVLKAIVDENRAAGQSPAEAIKNAADDGLRMYANLLETTAPQADFGFGDMARAWIASQGQNDGGRHAALIEKVMRARHILDDTGGGTPHETTLTSGRFAGCRVNDDVRRLVDAGRIKWTEPNEAAPSLFDPQGRPYAGVVRWTSGAPVIERITIVD